MLTHPDFLPPGQYPRKVVGATVLSLVKSNDFSGKHQQRKKTTNLARASLTLSQALQQYAYNHAIWHVATMLCHLYQEC